MGCHVLERRFSLEAKRKNKEEAMHVLRKKTGKKGNNEDPTCRSHLGRTVLHRTSGLIITKVGAEHSCHKIRMGGTAFLFLAVVSGIKAERSRYMVGCVAVFQCLKM